MFGLSRVREIYATALLVDTASVAKRYAAIADERYLTGLSS